MEFSREPVEIPFQFKINCPNCHLAWVVDLATSVLTCPQCKYDYIFVENLGPFFKPKNAFVKTSMGDMEGRPGIFDLRPGRNNFRLKFIRRANPQRAKDIIDSFDEILRGMIEGDPDADSRDQGGWSDGPGGPGMPPGGPNYQG